MNKRQNLNSNVTNMSFIRMQYTTRIHQMYDKNGVMLFITTHI